MTPSLLQPNLASGFEPGLIVNPDQADVLRAAGIASAEDIFTLPEEIVSGHPNRQVSRVRLGGVAAYLKKEHRVPWMERLRNWWSGFGLASKSVREARTLQRLREFFFALPSWIAFGETREGRAFLLVRELDETVPLCALVQQLADDAQARRELTREVGRVLATLHTGGFVHGDLFATHVLTDPDTLQVFFLDWQRARSNHNPNSPCFRDLATLDVSLPASLLGPRDRIRVLMTYLRHWPQSSRVTLSEAIREVRQLTGRLRQRRHVQSKSLSSLESTGPRLLCLRGDALRITSDFLRLWPEGIPSFLDRPTLMPQEQFSLRLPDGSQGALHRGLHRPGWCRRFGIGNRTWTSPERMRMNLLFRIQRFGIEAPLVLAAGEQPRRDGRIDAFLLTQLPDGVSPLNAWLDGNEDPIARRAVLRNVGDLLARLHQAGCGFTRSPEGLAVRDREQPTHDVVLTSVAGIRLLGRLSIITRWRDHRRIVKSLGLRAREDRAALREGYSERIGSRKEQP